MSEPMVSSTREKECGIFYLAVPYIPERGDSQPCLEEERTSDSMPFELFGEKWSRFYSSNRKYDRDWKEHENQTSKWNCKP
ncbi:MAG: hypothetical protein DRH32_09725 [Deltaproteobacteria bacterium]|nr:MAG: hypothetical protein DRH32_09725 [Deltaproteobacteria bacterium]